MKDHVQKSWPGAREALFDAFKSEEKYLLVHNDIPYALQVTGAKTDATSGNTRFELSANGIIVVIFTKQNTDDVTLDFYYSKG